MDGRKGRRRDGRVDGQMGGYREINNFYLTFFSWDGIQNHSIEESGDIRYVISQYLFLIHT